MWSLGGVRGWSAVVGVHLLCRRTSAPPSRSVCAAHMSPGAVHAEDALRTVLPVGLHHSCRLHRGGCNPILCGGAVVQPARRKRTLLCALTRSPPLLPLQPRVTLFLPHPFAPCSRRLVGGAQTSGVVASHCSATDRVGVTRRCLFIPVIKKTQPLPGNLLHARPSGDVPEHVHIRDGFTWEYAALALSELSPRRAQGFGLQRLSLRRKGETHRITRMGFYGTLKMIFYKVSRICAGTERQRHLQLWLLNAGLGGLDAPLAAACAATAEDEQQCSRPLETSL